MATVKSSKGNKNQEWLKSKLQRLWSEPQYCGLCLETQGCFFPLRMELSINESCDKMLLCDIIDSVMHCSVSISVVFNKLQSATLPVMGFLFQKGLGLWFTTLTPLQLDRNFSKYVRMILNQFKQITILIFILNQDTWKQVHLLWIIFLK